MTNDTWYDTFARTSEFRRIYRDDRVAFIRDCFIWEPGEKPAPYQEEILAMLDKSNRVAVRGPNGIGKTAIAAWSVLHFALTHDGEECWKCPTTASAWRQLTKYLWPEIHKWAARLKRIEPYHALITDNELTQTVLKLRNGEAFAIAPDRAELLEGAMADSLLYVFDEARAIRKAVFEVVDFGIPSDGSWEGRILALSTPGEPIGEFYEIHNYMEWQKRHVTLAEAIAAGRVKQEWAEARRKEWGEDSAIYQNRVLGEFA